MRNLHDEMYVQKVNNFNTALADGEFPASGSYIDAGKFDYAGFLILLGTLDSTITFAAQASATIDGTAATISNRSQAIAADDDNKWLFLGWRNDELNDKPYVTLDVVDSAGNNDYAAMVFLGWEAREQPVVQPDNFAYNKDPYATA